MEAANSNGIELKPENEHRKIGAMPQSVTIWAIVVTAGVFAAFAVAACTLPYPYSNESILSYIISQFVN